MKFSIQTRLKFIPLVSLSLLVAVGQQVSAGSMPQHIDGTNQILLDNTEPYDPGKEITENTHGPNPHGPNPNGPDPHDEQHDPHLPANDREKY
jgi:hypothetical protein